MPRFTKNPRDAATALADGALVALPTETVYGLGGLASSPDAIARIFRVKGRPSTHPVIVHIADVSGIDDWAADVPQTARTAAKEFWPGPLTIVVPRAAHVSDAITGGQPTIALRSPAHPAFRAVLSELVTSQCRSPGIAAPSANRFGKVSPTTAAHVATELDDYLDPGDMILDGGTCEVGVESTIIICRPHDVVIARSGAITGEQLSAHVDVAPAPVTDHSIRVPGALASHYAPTARVILASNDAELASAISELSLSADVGVIGLIHDLDNAPPQWVQLAAPVSAADYARDLYGALRRADSEGLTHIVALAPPAHGIGIAIRDRLRRASY